MSEDLSTKVCLVCCAPLFVSFAERLARDFKRVLLHVPHAGSFPNMNEGRVGLGLLNVELVDSVFGEHFEEVDLFCFPDLTHAALQVHLEGLGKRVWGARYGEELELSRGLCKEEMEKVGLPVQPWKSVKGLSALASHLKANANQHVKIDRWRGVTESFFSPRYDLVEPKLDGIAHDLGAFKEELEFLVEDDLPDRVEAGIDTFCIDGEYPNQTMVGIEAKDTGYICQVRPWSKIPEPLRRWNERMSPLFERAGSRTFLSNEIRIGKDKEPYMIDATVRMPSPPGELIQELFLNLSEVIWEGANGNLIEPVMAGQWGVEVILKSAWAASNHQPIFVPEGFQNFVKIYNEVRIDGKRYAATQDEEMPECAAVVGYGETLEQAVEMVREIGESIEGYGLKFGMGPVDQIKEQIAQLDDFGISPFEIEKSEKKDDNPKNES